MRPRTLLHGWACVALCGSLAAGAEAPAAAMSGDELLALVRTVEASTAGTPSILSGLDLRGAEGRALARLLRTTRVTVDFDRTGVADALDYLRTSAGISVVTSAKARAALARETPKISLRLRNLAVLDVLELCAAQMGEYRFSARHGVLMLLTNEEYRPATVLKVYDVRDITTPRRDFPGPRLSVKLTDEKEE